MGSGDNAEDGREYNPRWFGYLGILIMSVANFASVVDASSYEKKGEWAMCITFGCMTMALSLLILLFDRTAALSDKFDFKEQLDGKLEGYVLLFMVVWWIVGVGLMTRAGGIAYTALNIYFSSWFALAMSMYTLNEWGAARDVISFQELTHLSATLTSWYALFLASLVTLGSAAQVHGMGENRRDTAFAVAAGAISMVVAMCAILMHYKIVRCCNIKPGGMVELTTAILLNLWWMVGLGVLTEDGGVAATITGTGTVCDGSQGVPGSNLYFASWISFLSSMSITVKWKAAQAMRFAQAQERKTSVGAAGDSKATGENDDDAI